MSEEDQETVQWTISPTNEVEPVELRDLLGERELLAGGLQSLGEIGWSSPGVSPHTIWSGAMIGPSQSYIRTKMKKRAQDPA